MTRTREAPASEAEVEARREPEARPARTRQSRIRRDAPATRSGGGPGRGAASLAAATGGLARLVRLAAGVVAAIIVAGILLFVLKANPSNDIVSAVHDAARALVGPFDGMFKLDSAKATLAVNWGIAALVYLIVGALIARLIALIGVAGLRGRAAVAR